MKMQTIKPKLETYTGNEPDGYEALLTIKQEQREKAIRYVVSTARAVAKSGNQNIRVICPIF